jgi:hypothetical protein
MAKDAWTTGEVEAWLLNDESLYNWAMATVKRHPQRPVLLRRLFCEGCAQFVRERAMGELRVHDMRKVDWTEVVETMRDMAKEPEEKTSNG